LTYVSYALVHFVVHANVICVVELAKIWDDIVLNLYISASSLVPSWRTCRCVLSGPVTTHQSLLEELC